MFSVFLKTLYMQRKIVEQLVKKKNNSEGQGMGTHDVLATLRLVYHPQHLPTGFGFQVNMKIIIDIQLTL